MPDYFLWLLVIFQLLLIFLMIRIIFMLGLFVFHYRITLPFVPSNLRVRKMMLNSGQLDDKDTIVDLGSGTGTLLAAIAKKYPNANLVGVEQGRVLAALSKLRFKFTGKRVKIVQGDMFAYPVHDADAIVGFWISGLTQALVDKFEQECEPGTVIASNMFKLPRSESIYLDNYENNKLGRVYYYKKRA